MGRTRRTGQAWLLRTKGPGAGAGGGSQESRARRQQSHVLRALGTHRGWCPGEGQSSRGGEGRQHTAPGPRADSSPTPSSCWEPRQEPGARLPTFAKEIWAMGAPGWGFFVEKSGLPPHHPTLRLLSQEPGAGEGGPNHSPFQQQRGQEARSLKPSSRPRAWPGPRDQHPRHGTTASSLPISTGRDPLGAGDTEAWGRTGRVHVWLARSPPGAQSRRGLGPGDGFEVEGCGNQAAGTKNWGRAGQALPAARTARAKAQRCRCTAHTASKDPSGLCSAGGTSLTRPDHPLTLPATGP